MAKPGESSTDGTGGDQPSQTETGDDPFAAAFAEFSGANTDTAQAKAGEDDGAAPGSGEQPGEQGATRDNTDGAAGKDSAADTERATGSAEQAKPDRWASLNLSPEQRAAVEALEAQREQLDQDLRTANGRLSRYAATATATGNPSADGKSGEVTKPTPGKKTLESEPFKTLEREAPEVAAPLRTSLEHVDEALGSMADELAKSRKVTDAMTAKERNQVLLDNEAALESKHAGWVDICSGSDFKQWIAKQPSFVQGLYSMNGKGIVDVEAAADVIDRFKSSTGAAGNRSSSATEQKSSAQIDNTATRRSRQLEGSTTVRSSGAGRGSGAPDNFDDAFEFHAATAEQEAARNSKRR